MNDAILLSPASPRNADTDEMSDIIVPLSVMVFAISPQIIPENTAMTKRMKKSTFVNSSFLSRWIFNCAVACTIAPNTIIDHTARANLISSVVIPNIKKIVIVMIF